jgi:cytochrome c-type biogenesis protein CcmH
MTAFIVLGSAMALAALAFVLWPFLRASPKRRWSTVALSVAGVPLLAAGMYTALSDWDWDPPPAGEGAIPPMVLQMVAGLEQRLKNDPANLEGWLMLGRSYFELSDYARSGEAYQRAYTLSRGSNAQAALGLGEAMAFQDESTLMGPAAELFQQGFELDPRHPKALWYTGLVAYRKGDLAVAHERWSAMAALDMPEEVRQVLRARLAQIEGELTAP